jgi:hypothetical protein
MVRNEPTTRYKSIHYPFINGNKLPGFDTLLFSFALDLEVQNISAGIKTRNSKGCCMNQKAWLA